MGPDLLLWPSSAGFCPEGLGWEEGEPEGCPGGVCQESPGKDGTGGRWAGCRGGWNSDETSLWLLSPLRPTASPAKESTPQVVRPGLQPASPSSSLTMPTKRRCSKAAPSTLQPPPPPTLTLEEGGPHRGSRLLSPITFRLPRDIGVWCCLYMLTPLLFPAHCQ